MRSATASAAFTARSTCSTLSAPTAPTALRVRGLRKIHHPSVGAAPTLALAGIDLDVRAGELTAVMGPSGSGKSTLLHCLAGLDAVTSGSVAYADAAMPGGWLETTTMSPATLARLRHDRVGLVFPAVELLAALTAEENVLLPLDLAGLRPDRGRFELLLHVLGLGNRVHLLPAELTPGERQQVACARAVVADPAVLFADEPAGHLDARATADVLRFLRRVVGELSQTVVVVTHDANVAAYADRVVLVADGRVAGELENATPAEVLDALLDLELVADLDRDAELLLA